MPRLNGLSEGEYRALPLESYSSLKALLTSPEAFLKQSENPFTGNEFTDLGTAVHNLLQGLPQEKELSEKTKEILNKVSVNFLGNKLCGEFEVAFKTKYKNIPYKGKVDVLDGKSLTEIKTSSKATDLKTFRKEAYSRDYDLQAAMYLFMTKAKYHNFIVVNTVEPYCINFYPSSADFIDSGFLKLNKIVKAYKQLFEGEDGIKEV